MSVHVQYLDVPFSEKDQAKALGAWWDPEARKWFIPLGRATEPFARWLRSGSPEDSMPESKHDE